MRCQRRQNFICVYICIPLVYNLSHLIFRYFSHTHKSHILAREQTRAYKIANALRAVEFTFKLEFEFKALSWSAVVETTQLNYPLQPEATGAHEGVFCAWSIPIPCFCVWSRLYVYTRLCSDTSDPNVTTMTTTTTTNGDNDEVEPASFGSKFVQRYTSRIGPTLATLSSTYIIPNTPTHRNKC